MFECDYLPSCRCFRCREGHVHLKWNDLLLTFTPAEFSLLAQTVNAMNFKLHAEKPILVTEDGVKLNPLSI